MPTTVVKTIKSAGGDYSSLAAWEAAQNGNLVAADEIRVAECYGFQDTTDVVVAGGTVDSTRYLIIRAASGAEAQSPYDTSGTAYRLDSSGSVVGCISLQQDHTRVERIQIKATLDDNGVHGVFFGNGNFGRVTGCHITQTTPATFGSTRHAIFAQDVAGDLVIHNNIIHWDSRNGAAAVIALNIVNHTIGKSYVYYNTIRCGGTCPAAIGTQEQFTDVVYKNNLISDFPGGCFQTAGGAGAAGCTNNAASDGTVAGTAATNNYTYRTFTFVSPTDHHLQRIDQGARNIGADLSADANYPVSTDFDGASRDSTPDVGADEFTATVAAVTNPRAWHDPVNSRLSWHDVSHAAAAAWFDVNYGDEDAVVARTLFYMNAPVGIGCAGPKNFYPASVR